MHKLRDADAMLNAGRDLAAVFQALEVSQSTFDRWRNRYGGMKAEEAKRLKNLDMEDEQLKSCWPRRNSTRRSSRKSWRETTEQEHLSNRRGQA